MATKLEVTSPSGELLTLRTALELSQDQELAAATTVSEHQGGYGMDPTAWCQGAVISFPTEIVKKR